MSIGVGRECVDVRTEFAFKKKPAFFNGMDWGWWGSKTAPQF